MTKKKLNSYTTVYQIKKENLNWNQVSPVNISVKTLGRQQDRMLYQEWIDVTGIKKKNKKKRECGQGTLNMYTAGKPQTESINQSIECQYCRAKGRQPRFNAQVVLHNYVNKIIRDAVPQKNLLGNVEITVIRFFFIFITSLFSQAND